MKETFFSLALISFSLFASAQTPSSANHEGDVIQRAKNLLASSFDGRLPRVSLEYFLAYETDDAPAKWNITECKDRSAGGNAGPKRNSPTCIQADFDLNNGSALTILIGVEGTQDEKFSDAFIVSVSVTELTGSVRQFRSLGDLPMELHRWPRTPKDLPPPGRES